MSNLATVNEMNLEKLLKISESNALALQQQIQINTMAMRDINSLRNEVKELINSTQLQDHERYQIIERVKEKVAEKVKENEWNYKVVSSFIFQDIYKGLKKRFVVSKYAHIVRQDFKTALEEIENYKLSSTCLERIEEATK